MFDISDAENPMQLFKLVPETGVQMSFGWSVAVSGSTALIGAQGDVNNGGRPSGSAYLYDTTTGEKLSKFLPGDGGDRDTFGVFVAISESTAACGAPYHDDNGDNSGSAYLFNLADCGGGCVRSPAWQCDGDVDGDGQVNPVDGGLVQAAFGSLDDQDLCNYDFDCDGQINPVDGGIVQSLFGTCEAPREVCP